MKLNYYVYYKVPVENSARVRAAVGTLQRELADATGIVGRLLCRRDDTTTWMEIYENVAAPAPFETKLRELAERHGVSALLLPGSSRKQEIFTSF